MVDHYKIQIINWEKPLVEYLREFDDLSEKIRAKRAHLDSSGVEKERRRLALEELKEKKDILFNEIDTRYTAMIDLIGDIQENPNYNLTRAEKFKYFVIDSLKDPKIKAQNTTRRTNQSAEKAFAEFLETKKRKLTDGRLVFEDLLTGLELKISDLEKEFVIAVSSVEAVNYPAPGPVSPLTFPSFFAGLKRTENDFAQMSLPEHIVRLNLLYRAVDNFLDILNKESDRKSRKLIGLIVQSGIDYTHSIIEDLSELSQYKGNEAAIKEFDGVAKKLIDAQINLNDIQGPHFLCVYPFTVSGG